MKALELKALHEPLSPDQQDRYNRYKKKTSGQVDATIVNEREEVGKDEGNTAQIKSPTKEMPPITDEVLKTYNFARNSGVQQSADIGELLDRGREYAEGYSGERVEILHRKTLLFMRLRAQDDFPRAARHRSLRHRSSRLSRRTAT